MNPLDPASLTQHVKTLQKMYQRTKTTTADKPGRVVRRYCPAPIDKQIDAWLKKNPIEIVRTHQTESMHKGFCRNVSVGIWYREKETT